MNPKTMSRFMLLESYDFVTRFLSSCSIYLISGRSCRERFLVPRACSRFWHRGYICTTVMRNENDTEDQRSSPPARDRKVDRKFKGNISLNLPQAKKEVGYGYPCPACTVRATYTCRLSCVRRVSHTCGLKTSISPISHAMLKNIFLLLPSL